MCKFWIRIRFWIGIKTESRIRIGISMMHHADQQSVADPDLHQFADY